MRKSKRVTLEELHSKIMSYVEEDHLWYNLRDKLEKDFKVDFDWENSSYPDTKNILDLNSSNYAFDGYFLMNGTYMYLGWAGGDWESPVHFVLYIDPKNKLRCYIPREGNPYNKEYMQAYGNNDEDDDIEHDSDINEMMKDIRLRIEVV